MGDGGLQKVQTYKVSVALLVLYKLVMDFFYIRYISKIWEGATWCFINNNFESTIVSWIVYTAILMLVLPVLKKPFSQYRFSEFVLFSLLLFSVVPGLSICGAGTFSKRYIGFFYMYWIVLFLLTRFSCFGNENESFRMSFYLDSHKKRGVFRIICAICALCVLFVFLYFGGGTFFASSLLSSDVYTAREEWGTIILSMPVFLRYILANVSIVFCFLLLHFLGKKQYMLAGAVCLLQYMNFSCGAHKISLFMMVICIGVYILRGIMDARWAIDTVIGIICLIIGAYEIGGYWGFMGMGDRMLFLPNMLGWCYYDYFQKNLPMIYGLLGYETVGKGAVPTLIGSEYGEAVGTYANTGLFGDAVMMFGGCGVILSPVLWSLYLFVLDRVSKNVNYIIKMGMGVCWAVIMLNCPLTTSMLSHGGVMLLVLSYLQDGARKPG